jgi:hypothetical protein
MIRRMGMFLVLGAIVSMSGREARAQWAYGGWAWFGWNPNPRSIDVNSCVYWAMGAGMYDPNAAQAIDLNAQSVMMWNEHVARMTHESAWLHRGRNLRRNLRENPGKAEVESGDALNAALADLSDPRLGSAVLRAASATVPTGLIADLPFRSDAERVILMLDDLRGAIWPEVFKGEACAPYKNAFDDLVRKLRKEAAEGEVSPDTLGSARLFVEKLQSRLATRPLPDPRDQRDATRFLAACLALLGLLKEPDIQPAIRELRKFQDTNVGCLLGFMHAFNLRFGPATTPEQKRAYERLFEILDEARDRILAEAKVEDTTGATKQADPRRVIEVLQKFDQMRPKGEAPRPPRPGNSQ